MQIKILKMKLRVIANIALVMGLLSVGLTSCEEPAAYVQSYRFDNQKWKQDVKPTFTVDIKEIDKEYDFIITLRTTTDYKYNNLWIYLNTTTPGGQKAREPYEIKIAYPDGSWVGKKTGTIVENSLFFKRRKLPEKGKYTFVLEQGITENQIDQVLDIGLQVVESKKEK